MAKDYRYEKRKYVIGGMVLLLTLVYVARGVGEEREYVRRSVLTGLSDGVNIEVKRGLNAGDVVRGPQQVATDGN